jgi:hypothetical protein
MMETKNWLDQYPELKTKLDWQKQFVGKWIAHNDPESKIKLDAARDFLGFQHKMSQIIWEDRVSELVPDPLVKLRDNRFLRKSEYFKELKYI